MGFTANSAGVRKVLLLILALFGLGAGKSKKRGAEEKEGSQ